MLFTDASPALQGDHIRFYFSREAARAGARAGAPVFEVAVHYDGLLHRLLPLESVDVDPSWSVPARFQNEGFIVACAPIPCSLFNGS